MLLRARHCSKHQGYGSALRVYIQKWETDLKDGQEWKHKGDLEYITVIQGKDDGDFKIQERRGM